MNNKELNLILEKITAAKTITIYSTIDAWVVKTDGWRNFVRTVEDAVFLLFGEIRLPTYAEIMRAQEFLHAINRASDVRSL